MASCHPSCHLCCQGAKCCHPCSHLCCQGNIFCHGNINAVAPHLLPSGKKTFFATPVTGNFIHVLPATFILSCLHGNTFVPTHVATYVAWVPNVATATPLLPPLLPPMLPPMLPRFPPNDPTITLLKKTQTIDHNSF